MRDLGELLRIVVGSGRRAYVIDAAMGIHNVRNIRSICALCALTLGDSQPYDKTRVGLLFPLGPNECLRRLMDKVAFLRRASCGFESRRGHYLFLNVNYGVDKCQLIWRFG